MFIFSVCYKRWWKQLRPGLETLHNHRVHKSGEYSWFSSFNFLIHKPSEHFLFSIHKPDEHSWFSINEPGGHFLIHKLFDSQAWWASLIFSFLFFNFEFSIHKPGEWGSIYGIKFSSLVIFNFEFTNQVRWVQCVIFKPGLCSSILNSKSVVWAPATCNTT